MWQASRIRHGSIAIALLTVCIGVSYLATAWSASGAPLVAPVDDAYITFQYARQLARGRPFQYNDGDPPTTGMTSLLFGFLMAAAYALGLPHQFLPTLAMGLGLVWLALVAYLARRLFRHLAGDQALARGWGLAASILVVFAGPVQWACFNGMETGLFTVLTLAALDAFLAERTAQCALWSALAALTRPEGLILAVLVCGAFLMENALRMRAIIWKPSALLVGAVLLGFAPSLINLIVTGTAASTGLLAKLWWYNVPPYRAEIIGSVLLSWQRIILEQFLGWRAPPRWFMPPGAFLFAIVGWVGLGLGQRWRALFVTVAWFLAGTLATATLITASWQLGRYQAPLVPVVVVMTVYGLAYLWRRRAGRSRVLAAVVAALLLVLLAYTTLHHGLMFRRGVNTMVHQQLRVADWLRENLPPGTRVGVHDTGSLRYASERPTYDLIGLTTAGAAIPWRHGSGSVFELIESSPMRPDYFAIYPNIAAVPYLAATDLFAEKLFEVSVPDYAITSAGPVQGVWRAEWRLAGSGTQFYQPDVVDRTAGLLIVDTLDVADLQDEASHRVAWWNTVRGIGFPTELWQMAYRASPDREVLDGGRLLSGGIALDVTTSPGESLWMVARLHAQERGAVRVEVDGQDVGRWPYPAVSGWWLESVFIVPEERISSSRTRITLNVDPDSSDAPQFAPYHLWFLQGEPTEAGPTIDYPVDIVFDPGLRLLGFGLPKPSWRQGEPIELTLFWQAKTATNSDAKTFVHLFDSKGDMVAQADGWAHFETRPPFTWHPGEIVSDLRVLYLPGDVQPGTYYVEVGLYTPDGSARLPAYRDSVRQRDDHVPLMSIQVAE